MKKKELRSKQWFDNPNDPALTALYLERYLNYGMTRQELQSGKPIIGIAQSGSDLSPCNRHFQELSSRIKDGIRQAGGIPIEFPTHPIQETGKRPTAGLDRNLSYLSLVEVLFGYPIDGVILTTGCDKTTPAALMAAATVNIPAIVLSGGPMLDGNYKGKKVGSGTVVWEASKCIHAAECVKALPNVYKPKEKPWINVENATTEELKNQIGKGHSPWSQKSASAFERIWKQS